jgi:hypothetical protein
VPIPWREALGAIEGRAMDSLDAFGASGTTLDSNYVDGVSVSAVGTVRTHVFSLAASHNGTDNDCPCSGGPGANAFTNGDWACDRAATTYSSAYDSTPLWEGDVSTTECAPAGYAEGFFYVAVGATDRSDSLEVRILLNEDLGNEDIALTRVELYVR